MHQTRFCQQKIVVHAMFLRQTACHRAGAPCQAPCQTCCQSCQTLCQTLHQECSQTCCPGGSQACSLQLESLFFWPLLSMCSSSESNAHARESGTQSLSLSKAEHVSPSAVSGSFYGSYTLVSACRRLGCVPSGCEDTVACRQLLCKGKRGYSREMVGTHRTGLFFLEDKW